VGIVEGFKSFWSMRKESEIDRILDDSDAEVVVRDGLESELGRLWGPC